MVGTAVVAAAGDIACSPTDRSYAGGEGRDLECRDRAVAAVIRAARPQRVLALGDLQYQEGKLRNFRKVYASGWGSFKAITMPAPGNHEYETPKAAGYRAYFGIGPTQPLWHSANTRNGWHLVALDSNVGMSADSAQLRWFRKDLAAHNGRPTIVFWHHARWSSGAHGSDKRVAQLWNTCVEDIDCQLVLSGHDHSYERFAPMGVDGPSANGVRQFVVGTGGKETRPFALPRDGSELRSSRALGALVLTLQPQGYRWRFAAAVGQLTDQGWQPLRRR